jgi:1-deoxy-D-xylulose-5-phosphate reductoisomerase
MTQRLAVLGSTGSIGVNTLDVITRLKDGFKVVALSADSNIKALAEQARKFHPDLICVGNESLAKKIKKSIPAGTRVLFGLDGLKEIVSTQGIDTVVAAISGTFCLIPLVEAVKHRKKIALANKEALVSAGPIIMKLAKANGVRIIPIDSEHSAIFQCLEGRAGSLSKIYLTGSGGPLLNVNRNKFSKLSKKDVLNHPKWKMGKKISVDSATMMNKGLEVIEAKYLFGVDDKYIEVLIHPEAVIHSMIELTDGSVFAQLGVPDMRLPIQYALTFPLRAGSAIERLDFTKIGKLEFFKPDLQKFPCLALARRAASAGGTAPGVLCASDEEAVKSYLEGDLKFTDIPKIIEKVLSRHKNITERELTIYDILEADRWAREEVRSICCH